MAETFPISARYLICLNKLSPAFFGYQAPALTSSVYLPAFLPPLNLNLKKNFYDYSFNMTTM